MALFTPSELGLDNSLFGRTRIRGEIAKDRTEDGTGPTWGPDDLGGIANIDLGNKRTKVDVEVDLPGYAVLNVVAWNTGDDDFIQIDTIDYSQDSETPPIVEQYDVTQRFVGAYSGALPNTDEFGDPSYIVISSKGML